MAAGAANLRGTIESNTISILSLRRDGINDDDNVCDEGQWQLGEATDSLFIQFRSFSLQDALDQLSLQDRNLLVVIHGFNSQADILQTFQRTKQKIIELVNNRIPQAEGRYDAIIGLTWPGGNIPESEIPFLMKCLGVINLLGIGMPFNIGISVIALFETGRRTYIKAKARVINELAPRLNPMLRALKSRVRRLDVMAHSMGARLILEAICRQSIKARIDNLFCIGPAVRWNDLSSKYYGGRYRLATIGDITRNIFVFHSSRDLVLSLIFLLPEMAYSLGGYGSDGQTSDQVYTIDVTRAVAGHSDYYTTDCIYNFITRKILDEVDPALRFFRLDANGSLRGSRDGRGFNFIIG